MATLSHVSRYLAGTPAPHLVRPRVVLQPIQARAGRPTLDVVRLAETVADIAEVLPVVAVRSPDHWTETVLGLPNSVDAILPVSIPAYPTEVWNSHPAALVDRALPVVFWCLIDHDEPDFWRWSARDMLRAVGVDVHLVADHAHGTALLRALGVKRMLRDASLVVFGKQNFPWNAHAVGPLLRQGLGLDVRVRDIEDFRARGASVPAEDLWRFWELRRGRYTVGAGLREEALLEALRTTTGIRRVLEEEGALGFGVNCFGDLIIRGGRDVPCLAQCLLREEGYIAACDGDFAAMASMVLASHVTDRPCMMSNLYPVSYVGALTDHFGDPLAPGPNVPDAWRPNLARLAHCGFVGVVSPEMTPSGVSTLRDWGGTYEIHRDGSGCGVDADLAPGEPVTVVEVGFDGQTLLLARAEVVETTRHQGMPHCESSTLLRFQDLPGFVEAISREHTVVLYGDWVRELEVVAGVLGLVSRVF
ncbi:MAG: hypothetical protein JXR77_00640 [Lentisphaeria bacterium]|nr:hypothetical protein [Lentisphaeria bacterium]